MSLKSTELFAVFNQLAELSQDTRVSACAKLLKETENRDEELQYSLKRLIRGLSSSRAAARQGFALGLCALLREGRVSDVDKVLDELELDTKTSKKEKGEEEREKFIGRGFGYMALLRGGRLEKDVSLRIAQGLAALSQEKAWIRELCATAIGRLIEQANEEDLDEIEANLESLLKKSGNGADTKRDPEQIAVLVALERRRGADAREILTAENLKSLATPLAAAWRASPPRLHLVWEQLCPACAELGLGNELWTQVVEPALIKGGLVSPERKCAGFLVFGRLVGDLVRCNRPEEISQYMLSRATLSNLITHSKSSTKTLNEPARNALKCLVDALTLPSKEGDESFDRAKEQVIKRLLKFGDFDAKSGTDTTHRITAALSETFAQTHFDFLLSNMPQPWAVNAFVELGRAHHGKPLEKKVLIVLFEKGFFNELDETTGEVKVVAETERQQQNGTSTKTSSKGAKSETQSSDDEDEKSDEDEEEADDDDQKEEKRVDVKLICRQRFFTVLTRLAKSSSQDFIALLKELHADWENKVAVPKKPTASKKKQAVAASSHARYATVREETEESTASLLACREAAKWLESVEVGEANEKIVKVFEELILLVGLLLLVPEDQSVGDGDDENEEHSEFLKIDVADLVEDLKEASKRIVSSLITGKKPSAPARKSTTRSKKQAVDSEEATTDDDDPVAVTVDVMLALLAQPSTLIRDLVANLSKALAMNIADSKPALDTLLDVLMKPHRIVIKPGEEAVEEEEEDEEEEVEMDPEESEEENEDDDQNEAPRKSLTTKKSSSAKKKGDDDSEGESEEEEEEQDEKETMKEMQAYDKALGEYLKQRRLSTKKTKENAVIDAEKEAITFKLRVLDVLEAIVNRASEKRNLLLHLPLALLEAAEIAVPGKKETSKKQLQGPAAALFQRLLSVQRKYFRSKQLPDSIDSLEEFERVYQGTLEFLSTKAKHKDLARLSMETIGFFIRVGRKNPQVNTKLRGNMLVDSIAPVIRLVLTGHSNSTFVESKSVMELVERFPDLSWSLLKSICDVQPRTPFQRGEQIQLLSRLLRLRKDSIPVDDSAFLRQYVVQLLKREEEDLVKGKIKADKLRTCLRFVQQVQSVAGATGTKEGVEFTKDLEPIFVRLVQNSNSPAVKQMVMAMSSPQSKQAIEAAHDAKKADAQQQQQQQQQANKKKRLSTASEGENSQQQQQAKKFFEDVAAAAEEDNEAEPAEGKKSKKNKGEKNKKRASPAEEAASSPSKKQRKEGKKSKKKGE